MSLYRRKNSSHWWVKITHNGRAIQQSTGTSDKSKATEYHDRLKTSLWEQQRLGVKPRRVWEDAVVRYLGETARKASHDTDKAHFRWLDSFLRGVVLKDINRDVVERLIAAKVSEGVKPSTVNRTMEVVRTVLRKALQRAGIENFRWHDLRHTWASWHAQAGTPLHVLQELGGWETVEVVRKYAHLSSEHLAQYVDRAAVQYQEERGCSYIPATARQKKRACTSASP